MEKLLDKVQGLKNMAHFLNVPESVSEDKVDEIQELIYTVNDALSDLISALKKEQARADKIDDEIRLRDAIPEREEYENSVNEETARVLNDEDKLIII
jgi:methionine synthase II (cobalamin-independent)